MTEMPLRPLFSWPQLRGLLRYFAAWTPLVLVYAMLVSRGDVTSSSEALVIAARTVGWAAALGLAVRWFARRSPPIDSGRLRWMATHLGAAFGYSAAWNLGILVDMRTGADSWSATLQAAESWFGWQLLYGGITYALLALITWKTLAEERAYVEATHRLESETLRIRTELEALRGRLNPHFLFNTLHSLTVLARHDGPRTEAALTELAELLRYVLDPHRGAREQVRLGDELSFVQRYLALEALRLGDRLRVEWDVDDETLDALIPSLLLQPLVENAIRHAIAPRATGGTVRITARYDADRLLLTVDDDGAQRPHEGPDDTPNDGRLLSRPDTAGTGVALATLRRRLALQYGDEASLDTQATGRGFRVAVGVPA
jgi:two-component system, LytTR family, sensor kinase